MGIFLIFSLVRFLMIMVKESRFFYRKEKVILDVNVIFIYFRIYVFAFFFFKIGRRYEFLLLFLVI